MIPAPAFAIASPANDKGRPLGRPGSGCGGKGDEGQGWIVQRQALPDDLKVIQHRPGRGGPTL